MIPFKKPGASDSYDVMGEKAARLALDDANLQYSLIQQAYVGYVYADSTAGQAALRQALLPGAPNAGWNPWPRERQGLVCS